MKAAIKAIEYYLPEGVLSSRALAEEYPGWTVDKIEEKTGIRNRHVAGVDECASDLGFQAARKLLDKEPVRLAEVDYLLFCTQSPDYFLPTTACILQDRLGLPTSVGALDFNLGCSGYVYGLSLAKGLIESGQAKTVLLITAETYSKFIHPGDRSVRTLFGDAAAATIVQGVEADHDRIGPFLFGTDGRGARNLMVSRGGMRQPGAFFDGPELADASGSVRTAGSLFMNGPEIFSFTLRTVPASVSGVLEAAGLKQDDIDLFVFHQANQYMLEHLRKKISIPEDKFIVAISDCGNTVSSTIPIALKSALDQGRLQMGHRVLVVGFGVGYSWGAALLQWT